MYVHFGIRSYDSVIKIYLYIFSDRYYYSVKQRDIFSRSFNNNDTSNTELRKDKVNYENKVTGNMVQENSQTGAGQMGDASMQSNQNNSIKGNTNMSTSFTDLASLLSQPSLVATQNSIPEIDGIVKDFKETVLGLRQNITTDHQKATLPQDIKRLTSTIGAGLPGFAISTVIGNICVVMPVLFYKIGITDQIETVQIGQEAPRGYAKVPNSFMSKEMQQKIIDSYMEVDGKRMSRVLMNNPRIFNLERLNKKGILGDQQIREVVNTLLNDWGSIMTLIQMYTVKEGGNIPSPYSGELNLYGVHKTAIAKVESVNPQDVVGAPDPTNLVVKLATTNKNGQNYGASIQSQTVSTTKLNVQLAVMSPQQFADARHANRDAAGSGPIFPIVSIGHTVPGETMGHNSSLVSLVMGLYAALAANTPAVLAEAIRGKEVGHRGNLGVFNNLLNAYTNGQFNTQKFLTTKNIVNVEEVNGWLSTYMSRHAVYVIDVPAYLDNASEAEFWMGLANSANDSTYARAFVAACDALSNGAMSKVIAANKAMPQRDPLRHWIPGDSIIRQTKTLRPAGIAANKDGKYFDLAEVDAMFLRQDSAFGNQEVSIMEYESLVAGTHQITDARVRQLNIVNRLQGIVNNTAIIEGWSVRYILGSAIVATLEEAMKSAGTLTVSASQFAGTWQQHVDNDLVGHIMNATLTTQPGSAMGYSPMFYQF